MSTGDRNALNVLGEHLKDTTPAAHNRVRLAALRGYLRGLPSLDFSNKGRANICARFGLNEDELSAAVAAMQARPPYGCLAAHHRRGRSCLAPHQRHGRG